MAPRARSATSYRVSAAANPLPLGRRAGACALLAVAGACGGGGGSSDSATFTASAGADQTVEPYEVVTLGGVVSGGSPAWRQLSGPEATVLGGTDSPTLRVVAPEDPVALVFELTVLEGGDVRARDEVTLTVEAPGAEVTGALRRRILVNGGGAQRAVRADHDASTQRIFVLDGVANVVIAYDVTSPDAPSLAGFLLQPVPRPGFTPGRPVDVVAEDGVLAVVHEATSRQVPGRVVFYDPLTLAELSSWSCGAGPIDADITADGQQVAVACAGDLVANSTADPQGTVTWVQVPPTGAANIDPTLHVRTFNFIGYDTLATQLIGDGVRLPRLQSGVARDLEPRAVVFSPDGASIYVSLAANNALARVDIAGLVVRDLHGLELADWSGSPGQVSSLTGLRPVPFVDTRPTATSIGGQVVPVLDFEGVLSVTPGATDDEAIVELVTARGPVLPAQNIDADVELERPFVLGASGPRLVRVAVSAQNGEIEVLSETILRSGAGTPLTARSNLRVSAPGLANHDEAAVDLSGAELPLDPFGVHIGDATRVAGEIWLADQHRPSLVRLASSGSFVARYVPFGANATTVVGTERLPAVYGQRVLGGGFEGVAASADGATIHAILGRPLDNPDTADDATSRASRNVRVVAVERTSGAVTGEYVYVLERAGHVVRDLELGADGRLVVLEEDPATSFCALFRADLADATNLSSLGGNYASVSAALETTAPRDLHSLAAPVVPLAKSLALDLGETGTRLTAFAATDGAREFPLLVRADAHGLTGATLSVATLTYTLAPGAAEAPLTLSLLGALGRQLDASDVDEGSALASYPVRGLRQALDILAFEVDGQVLIAGADGGTARVIGGTPGYDETTRVNAILLDTLVFPDAATLARDDRLGRLRISRVDGDPNGDGLYERLIAFGGRSVFLARGDGSVVWDSGDRLERRVLARQPERAARLDAAAEDAGLAPQSLALLELGGVRLLVVGCAGSGSLAAYDLSRPGAARFAGFLPTTLGADPVDLAFVPAHEAPGARPILIAVDAATGAVELLDVAQ
jgi:hypothetical protein